MGPRSLGSYSLGTLVELLAPACPLCPILYPHSGSPAVLGIHGWGGPQTELVGRVGDDWQTSAGDRPTVAAPHVCPQACPVCMSPCLSTVPVCALWVTWATPGMQVSVCAPPLPACTLFSLSSARPEGAEGRARRSGPPRPHRPPGSCRPSHREPRGTACFRTTGTPWAPGTPGEGRHPWKGW